MRASTVRNISIDRTDFPTDLMPDAVLGSLNQMGIQLADNAHILMAVSGGPDSLGMAACLYNLIQSGRADLTLSCVTVDHRLRPESDVEARMVAGYMDDIGIDHTVLVWDDHPSKKIGSGMSQADARHARYDLMINHAHEIGATHLATGHQLTDQADTVLQRIAHGSGVDGIAGIPPMRMQDGITIIRPVLNVDPADLMQACRVMGWQWAVDPTNKNTRYSRGKLSVMRDAFDQAGFDEHRLARVATRARLASDALDQMTDTSIADYVAWQPTGYWRVDWAGLSGQPTEIIHRVIIACIHGIVPADYPPRFDRLSRAVDRLLDHTQDRLTLGGCLIERMGDTLIISREIGAMGDALIRRQGEGDKDSDDNVWDNRLMIDWHQLDGSVAAIDRLTNDRWAVIRDQFEPLSDQSTGNLPLPVRRSLPVYLNKQGQVIDIPHLSGNDAGLTWKYDLTV